MLTRNWCEIFIKFGFSEEDGELLDNICYDAIGEGKVLFLNEQYVDEGKHNLILNVNYYDNPSIPQKIIQLRKLLSFIYDVSQIEYFKESIKVNLIDENNFEFLNVLLKNSGYELVKLKGLSGLLNRHYQLVLPDKEYNLPSNIIIGRNYLRENLTITLKNS